MPVELPLKPRQLHPFAKKQPSKNNTSGPTGGKKNRVPSGAGLQILAQAKKDAQQQTKDNRVVLLLLPSGKRKFVKAKDLK
jgi:hypothetical protein